jgi:class 3 adenylate cyclase
VAVLDFSSSWFGQFFAATHPERTRALVLDGPTARIQEAIDYPEGLSGPEVEKRLSRVAEVWGTGGMLRHLAPSVAGDDRVIEWAARCERISCTPDEAVARWRGWYDADVRALLPAINVPTLVLVRQGHRTTDQHRYVARHIKGARSVELPGPDRAYFAGDTRPMLDAIEQFLTGKLPTYEIDRVLSTVVFTDIVGSTDHASRLGDGRWRELLAAHDAAVRAELERFRGREIKSTGDGFLATFDGPGRALRCASAIRDDVQGLGVEVRIGLHTGEIELQGEDVGGIAVHIAQRVMAEAHPGEIVVSSTVKDLVAGSGIVFEDRGMRELRGVSEPWRLFSASI